MFSSKPDSRTTTRCPSIDSLGSLGSCCPAAYSRILGLDDRPLPSLRPGDLLRGSLPFHPMIVAQYQTSLQFSARFHTATEGCYMCTHPVDTTDAKGAHAWCYAEVRGQMRVSPSGGEVYLQKPRIETHAGMAIGTEDPTVNAGVLHPSGGEYEIWLLRAEDEEAELGLTLGKQDSALVIESVFKPGRVYEWNQQNHNMQVNPGDEILQVNDVTTCSDRLYDECMANKDLHLKLRRKGFTLAGQLRLGVAPGWSAWSVDDVVLVDCDLDIRCGGILSRALLREHIINWVSLSALGLLAVPFCSCEDGYQHWVLAASLPLLVRGMYKEAELFKEHFRSNPKILAEFVGLTHPVVMMLSSRIEQMDIMTDTLFVARALQCSAGLSGEWQASWAQVPLIGSCLAAAAGMIGYGGFSLLLFLATVLFPQGVLGYRHGRALTSLETSFEKDPCGVDGSQDILPLQDLSSSACYCLIEKSLETHAQVQYNGGEAVVNLDVRLPVRIFIKCCLENFLQLWNQVTFLSLTYSDDEWADLQVGGSIVLSLVLLLIRVHKLTPEEGSYWDVLVHVVSLPVQVLQLLTSMAASTCMWALSMATLAEYTEEEALSAQLGNDDALRDKYLISSGGNLDPIELDALRANGRSLLIMAWRRHFFLLGLASHRFTVLPKATVVAAVLLWCILAVLMRLAGVFLCTSHAWNLSTLRCIPAATARGTSS